MSEKEHSINRANRTRTNSTDDDESDEEDEEPRSEAEIRRELRGDPLGEAILQFDRRRRS